MKTNTSIDLSQFRSSSIRKFEISEMKGWLFTLNLSLRKASADLLKSSQNTSFDNFDDFWTLGEHVKTCPKILAFKGPKMKI